MDETQFDALKSGDILEYNYSFNHAQVEVVKWQDKTIVLKVLTIFKSNWLTIGEIFHADVWSCSFFTLLVSAPSPDQISWASATSADSDHIAGISKEEIDWDKFKAFMNDL